MNTPAVQVIEDAEVAATYFRNLVEKGVPAQHAIWLTSSYIGTVINARMNVQEPRKPWEEE